MDEVAEPRPVIVEESLVGRVVRAAHQRARRQCAGVEKRVERPRMRLARGLWVEMAVVGHWRDVFIVSTSAVRSAEGAACNNKPPLRTTPDERQATACTGDTDTANVKASATDQDA